MVSHLGEERSSNCSAARGNEHYRVAWDEQHESIVYSTDGVIVTAPALARAREPTSVTR